MNRVTEVHLSHLTEKDFVEFIQESFITYASSSTTKAFVELGCKGNGKYAVRVKSRVKPRTTKIHTFATPSEALQKYRELLSE